MQIVRVIARNFRGILEGEVFPQGHSVFVGDNNAGKSTLLESIDLVLGPERLSRRPVVDEHDFYAGHYVDPDKNETTPIQVEVVVADLSEEQQRHFKDHLEWWDSKAKAFVSGPPAAEVDKETVWAALRVFFNGWYDIEEDDFAGDTYYANPKLSDGSYQRFTAPDKRKCGFLYLRTLRTGARALSLERGSLLDIILRLQNSRLKMWEDLLDDLRDLPVGGAGGIGTLLADVQKSVHDYIPSGGAEDPHMRVSDLTREMLRRTLTVFMGTGATRPDGTAYAAPYQHQGTGTINTLVLALLSIIAELKQNVIFAMEEPEIALPPHTQKRIIHSLRKKSAQALFTSHSPYVLEEFDPEQVRILKRVKGVLTETPARLPPSVKPKAYRAEFRTRFCEALLAKYVLIVEGRTEFDAIPASARRLAELQPDKYKSLEHLGVAIVDAQTDSQVEPLGKFFQSIGKIVFAVFDKQTPAALAAIKSAVDHTYESQTKGFENLVLLNTPEAVLRAYAVQVVSEGSWPTHLASKKPTPGMPISDLQALLKEFFALSKGRGCAADLLASCPAADDLPQYIRDTLRAILLVVDPPLLPPVPVALPPPPPLTPPAAPSSGAVAPVAPAAAATATAIPAPPYVKFVPHPPKPKV